MRLLISFLFLLITGVSSAQFLDTSGNLIIDGRKYLKSKVDTTGRKSGWQIVGLNTLTVNQNTFSNWMPGGENSVSFNAKVDYEFNYRKKRTMIDNRTLLEYGFLDNKTNGTRKTADNINVTSSYGYLLKQHWYLTASINLRTQFSAGYNYSTTPKTKLSNLFAPAYISLGIGVNYNPIPNLQFSFHPITSRTTIVADPDLQKKGNYGLKNDDDLLYFEIGAYIGGRYKLKLFENVYYDNNIGIFSNYTDDPLNFDVVYAGVLDMKINNFMSTQLSINLLYDENQIKQTQLKQTLGIGLTYKIDNGKPPKVKKKRKELIQSFPLYPKSSIDLSPPPLNKANYDRILQKNTVRENSTYLKSETLLTN